LNNLDDDDPDQSTAAATKCKKNKRFIRNKNICGYNDDYRQF
jgi:hypothetical protein